MKKVYLVRHLLKASKPSPGRNSHYVFQIGNGTVVQQGNDICFARFKANSIQKARLYINQHERVGINKEELLEYIDWVVKESPWKKAFIGNKNRDFYLKNGLQINPNVSSKFAVGAMIACREGWEFTDHIPDMKKYQKMGFSKNFSYILAEFLCDNGSIRDKYAGHGTLSTYHFTMDCFTSFKKCIEEDAKPVPMKVNAADYHGIHTIFKRHLTKNGKSPLFIEYVQAKNLLKKQGEGYYATMKINMKDEETLKLLKELDNA